MRRLRIFVLAIPLAVLAAPLLASCLSCCPPLAEAQSFKAPMPCCNEECGTFLVAGVRDPALKSFAVYEPMPLAIFGVPFVLKAPVGINAESLSAFLASSPPLRARPLLPLRI